MENGKFHTQFARNEPLPLTHVKISNEKINYDGQELAKER